MSFFKQCLDTLNGPRSASLTRNFGCEPQRTHYVLVDLRKDPYDIILLYLRSVQQVKAAYPIQNIIPFTMFELPRRLMDETSSKRMSSLLLRVGLDSISSVNSQRLK